MENSKEFENIFNDCLERLLLKDETVEQCLTHYPEYQAQLRPLLETATTTRRISSVQPRPEFRDRARYQFLSALRERQEKKRRFAFVWLLRPQLTAVLASFLVMLLVGGSTVVAAKSSMPDDLLYPVKLAAEQAQVALTPSSLGKAELQVTLVDNRVQEIASMAVENKPEKVEKTTQQLSAQLKNIADLTTNNQVKEGEVPTVSVSSAPLLAPQVAPPVPTTTVPSVMAAEKAATSDSQVLMSRDASKEASGSFEAVTDNSSDPKLRLKITVLHNAANHSARLRALLSSVPESARPALLKAIATSETGYQRALQSLNEAR